MRHTYHLVQILRAQATRPQVSPRSVVTESRDPYQQYLAKLVASYVTVLVLASCGMHTTWHTFCVLPLSFSGSNQFIAP